MARYTDLLETEDAGAFIADHDLRLRNVETMAALEALGDTTAPATPTGLSLSSTFRRDPVTGLDVASVTAVWTKVADQDFTVDNAADINTAAIDGYLVSYQADPADQYSREAFVAQGATPTFTIDGLPLNKNISVRVRTVSKSGMYSAGYVTVSTASSKDTTPPTACSTPVMAAIVNGVTVKWDGLDNAGAAMAADLRNVEVHVSTVNGFTPTAATLKTTLDPAGGTYVFAGTGGSTYYGKLIPVDYSGNRGAASVQAQATAGIAPQPSDGAAPGSSPTPTVTPAQGALAISWAAVANNDPVTYDVHISTTSGFTPGVGTKAAETASTYIFLKTDAAGAALVYGTTYYIKIVARDRDGSAAASAQASGSPAQVGTTDITPGSITTNLMTANTINGDRIQANTLVADKVATGNLTATVSITTGKLIMGSLANGTNRVEGDAAGVRLIKRSAGGVDSTVINLDTATGSGLFTGTVSASTVTGSLIQTDSATNVERIVIDGVSAKNTISFYPAVTLSGVALPATIRVSTNFTTSFGQDLTLDSGRGSSTAGTGGLASYLTLRPGYGGSAGFSLNAQTSYGEIQTGGELRLTSGTDASSSEVSRNITMEPQGGGIVAIVAGYLIGVGTAASSPGPQRLTQWERSHLAVSFTAVAQKDTSVTFAYPFSARPEVIATCSNTGSSIGNFYTQVFNISASSCTVRLRDVDSVTRTGTDGFDYLALL